MTYLSFIYVHFHFIVYRLYRLSLIIHYDLVQMFILGSKSGLSLIVHCDMVQMFILGSKSGLSLIVHCDMVQMFIPDSNKSIYDNSCPSPSTSTLILFVKCKL